jgi:hypothetical protein
MVEARWFLEVRKVGALVMVGLGLWLVVVLEMAAAAANLLAALPQACLVYRYLHPARSNSQGCLEI